MADEPLQQKTADALMLAAVREGKIKAQADEQMEKARKAQLAAERAARSCEERAERTIREERERINHRVQLLAQVRVQEPQGG